MYLDSLDALDRKILGLLIENARLSYSEIGQAAGISRVAVKARVAAMEERGIIEEYTAVINPQKIGGAISCYFEIEACAGMLEQVAAALAGDETVTQVYRVTGRNRLHVHAVASGQDELEALLSRLDRLDGISAVDCHVILSRLKDVKGLRL